MLTTVQQLSGKPSRYMSSRFHNEKKSKKAHSHWPELASITPYLVLEQWLQSAIRNHLIMSDNRLLLVVWTRKNEPIGLLGRDKTSVVKRMRVYTLFWYF
jgi:hypothetical protein